MQARGTVQAFHSAGRATQDCAAICVQTIQYCLDVGAAHAEPSHVQLLQDCADICGTASNFVLRSSPNHAGVAASCADICDLCAASCEKFSGDAQMKACANQCILCATACRQMAGLSLAAPGGAGLAEAGDNRRPRAR